MKHPALLNSLLPLALLAAAAWPVGAAADTRPDAAPDTLRQYDIEAALVVASPKEHKAFRRQPVSASVFSAEAMSAARATAPKDLSALAPNVYMPAYGSRLTSAMYVRGVGSRVGSPAVGLYVDNVPVTDKTAYDFTFLDVERVDLLRGPQGTLYGRGAMGGLVRVSTADPVRHTGTHIGMGFSGRDLGRHVKATTFLHPSERLHLSAGGFIEGSNGFFSNIGGGRADSHHDAGGRIRATWLPTDSLRLSLTLSGQQGHERSNPYTYLGATGEETLPQLRGAISQNRQSNYRRRLLTTALGAEWKLDGVMLTSQTAFQWGTDRLFMDQDYIAADIFSLCQRQRFGSWSEELTLKGQQGRWQWTMGAFLLTDRKNTSCPVLFHADGIGFLNTTFRSVMPPFITLLFTDQGLRFDARLRSAGTNAALFHQSVINDLGLEGLSVTAGLRLDYDRHRLSLLSPANACNYRFQLQMPEYGLDIDTPFRSDAALGGRDRSHSWQLLPKVALTYDLGTTGNVYFSVAKGYRSGGYNLENYSDLSQALLRRNIMLQVRDYSTETILALPLTDESKAAAVGGMSGMIAANMPEAPSVKTLAYKPEHSWCHELGTHLNLLDGALQADAALFFVRTHNLQISRFAPSGLGRVTINAGTSRTWGAEASLRSSLLADRLTLAAAFGLADSRFSRYDGGTQNGRRANYSGHRVPYAPRHTLALDAQFRQPVGNACVKAIVIGAALTGAGKIWWDEANTPGFAAPFQAQASGRAALEFSHLTLTLWGSNLTGARHTVFAFESMGRRFAQYARPRCFGLEAALTL